MDARDLRATIQYYSREKLYNAMQTESVEGMRKFPADSSFKLLHGLSFILQKRYQESIRELNPLQNDSDVILGAVLALITAHRKCSTVDKEALSKLDSKLKEERKHATETQLYYAAITLMNLNKVEKAREYSDKILKINPKFPDGLASKGWIELLSGSDSKARDIDQFFDAAIENSPGKKCMDALFGKARYFETKKNFDDAITCLNQLVVRFSSFSPPLIEKMKNQLALLDIDQALETANRVLSADPHCLEALKLKALTVICRDGNYEEASLSLRVLFTNMEKTEPNNSDLFLECSQLFSRVCSRNMNILSETYKFAEKAAQLDPVNAELITELGFQCFLQGKIKEASRFYRNASKIDESSVVALSGLTLCQLAEGGNNEQANQQVEFLREVQGSEPSPDLLLMSAQIVHGNANEAMKYLNEAIEIHFQSLQDLPYGAKYLVKLDPDFLLQVVKEYLNYAPVQSVSESVSSFMQQAPEPLKQSLRVLEAVTKACPGLLEGLFQLAYVQFLCGDIKSSSITLQHIFDDVDAAHADSHLLMAQIQLRQGNYQQAAASLEVGVSFNFKIRDHPLYYLITAIIQKQKGETAECITTLKTAMSLSSDSLSKTKSVNQIELNLPDKASLFLELINAYKESNQMPEAIKTMEEALQTFKSTSEEGRVTLANADLVLQRGEIKQALELLKDIMPGESYYRQARCKMAEIHLNHRKDRQAYAEIFRELVLNCPGPESLVMLGDAYMAVLEPERAIESYEKALSQSPGNSDLARKIGHALIKTHQYGKAINYYKEALKNEVAGATELILDLAELYMKLKQYDKAEKLLNLELNSKSDQTDLLTLMTRTKLLLLLSKIREKAGNLKTALETLKETSVNQERVLKRFVLQQSKTGGEAEEQYKISANICRKMGELANILRDYDSAIRFYQEALTHLPKDKDAMASLARLYMQINDLEECQTTCLALQEEDPDNEAATVMLADLAFRKTEFETASFHFQQLLSRHPDYWTALARLVEVMRRTGRLDEVPPYLTRAEEACERSNQEAGLSYCKGLHEWYSGNLSSALKFFSSARRDAEWGQQAIYNMIKICLNSEEEGMDGNSSADDDEAMRNSREMALRTAERLLGELQPRPIGGSEEIFNHRLLGNFLLIASRQKVNVERALQDFASLASQEAYKDNVGVALGLSTAYLLLRQTPRARNQLKRVSKNIWTFEDAEYLEQCWLLLANVYVQNSKYDLANELLKRVLQHNRACTKAYELSGYIAEKDQSYREAAAQYEQAWSYGGKINPAIGYKLAYNHMKAKRYTDAIDVCNEVLKLNPDYPKIRKDILEKSRNNLRS